MANQPHGNHGNGHGGGHHYILPDGVAWKTFGALIMLTIITVGLSFVHLGPFNFVVGMFVATVKAFLVVSIFMGLKHDDRANAFIFGSGFLFLLIFFGLTAPDTMFRGDVYTTGKQLTLPVKGVSKFKKPWEPTPELVAHGKAIYAQQCVSCHGAEGLGNGPAAGALNPKPRNFTADAGWKNGRKPSGIFKTLREGIPGGGMASFATIPAEDRWALSHYVASIGPSVLTDTQAELVAEGVDPSKDTLGSTEAPSIDADTAIQIMAKEAASQGAKGNVRPGNETYDGYGRRLDAKTFAPPGR